MDDWVESSVQLTKIENIGEAASYSYQGLYCGRDSDTLNFSCAEFEMAIDYSGADMQWAVGSEFELDREIQASNRHVFFVCIYK